MNHETNEITRHTRTLPITDRLKNANNVVTSKTARAVVAAPDERISASGRVDDHVTLLSVICIVTSNSHLDDVIVIVLLSVISDDVPVIIFTEPVTDILYR